MLDGPMRIKPRMKWVPVPIIKEIDNIKKHYNFKKDSQAFEKMAEFVPIGIELEKMRERLVLFDIFSYNKRRRK